MKYAIILITLFLFGVTGKKPPIIKDKGHYRVAYSVDYRQPVWVEYNVMCTESKYSRKGLDFYPEPGIITSDNRDYSGNDWDKGHLAPAADFACDSLALISTFSYLNCSLQHWALNRGVWKHLETRERELAKRGPVKVRVELEFGDVDTRTKGGARIPTVFVKILQYAGVKEEYRFPNRAPNATDPEFYLVRRTKNKVK
jgi:DNA/RNA endonuclease G (NUC1)